MKEAVKRMRTFSDRIVIKIGIKLIVKILLFDLVLIY